MQWANGEILGSEASSNCRIEGGGCVRHVQVLYVVVELCVRQVQVPNVVVEPLLLRTMCCGSCGRILGGCGQVDTKSGQVDKKKWPGR